MRVDDSASAIFQHPLINNIAFHPRPAQRDRSSVDGVIDGVFDVSSSQSSPRFNTVTSDDTIELGWRLYRHPTHACSSPVVLLFHGNAENCGDYDPLSKLFHKLGVSLMVIDFRGYGWSTGTPNLTTVATDAECVLLQVDEVLSHVQMGELPLILYGRSLGSACAIHLALIAQRAQAGGDGRSESSATSAGTVFGDAAHRVRALILESAVCSLFDLPMVQQLVMLMPQVAPLMQSGALTDPLGNEEKLRHVKMPLQIIHGQSDTISPVSQGQKLFGIAGTSSEHKQLVIIPDAGHNDLTAREASLLQYSSSIQSFVQSVCPPTSPNTRSAVSVHSGAAKPPTTASTPNVATQEEVVSTSTSQNEVSGSSRATDATPENSELSSTEANRESCAGCAIM